MEVSHGLTGGGGTGGQVSKAKGCQHGGECDYDLHLHLSWDESVVHHIQPSLIPPPQGLSMDDISTEVIHIECFRKSIWQCAPLPPPPPPPLSCRTPLQDEPGQAESSLPSSLCTKRPSVSIMKEQSTPWSYEKLLLSLSLSLSLSYIRI